MVSATLLLAALGLTLSVTALQVTTPSNTTGWETKGSQLIEWDSVSTDPSNFTIQLITPSDPNNPITIATDVKTSDKSYIYTPSSDLTAGSQYRVNIISTTNTAGILAQSNYFAVEEGTSTVTPTGSTSASASASASRSTTSAASQTSNASSASSAAASASQSSGGASMLIAPTGLLALVAAALGVLA